MSGNTSNAIKTLAEAQAVTLVNGNDRNMIESIATAKEVAIPASENDDNALAALVAELED